MGKLIIEDNEVIGYEGEDKIIVIPEGVTAIREYAFEDCESLVSIVVPTSVEEIETDAFDGCENLKFIQFCHKDPCDIQMLERWDPWNPRTFFGTNSWPRSWAPNSDCALIVPDDCVDAYKQDPDFYGFEDIIDLKYKLMEIELQGVAIEIAEIHSAMDGNKGQYFSTKDILSKLELVPYMEEDAWCFNAEYLPDNGDWRRNDFKFKLVTRYGRVSPFWGTLNEYVCSVSVLDVHFIETTEDPFKYQLQ